jgi:radical SAM-linked protein
MIDKIKEEILFSIQAPGQYSGGEYGAIIYDKPQELTMAISFPDLYTIGMSNQAIKIIYALANSIEGVQCERVFAPMQDMEDILREKDLSHFTIETAIPLKKLDLLAFSMGYELCFTNLLNILELGKIPLRNSERDDSHPIIIAGGVTVTNPIPYGSFIDCFYIGEGEGGYVELLEDLRNLKIKGALRQDLLNHIKSKPYIWYEGKKEKTTIIKYNEFGRETGWNSAFPVPTIDVVQNHGVVEIMRGCPNKCRFCHAGVYYRPKREKDWNLIIKEIDTLVYGAGYKDITLSSLSSGDYTNISNLIDLLNERYSQENVSFSLPSLRVNSLSLDLIEKLGEVKKSGLTFAVEAAREDWQHGLNKDVSEEKIIEILREAKRRGWKQAKFYFMLGLPMSFDNKEEVEMITYLNRIQKATRMNLSVNIGTFIPKVFTPFKNSRQLEEQTSFDKIIYIKKNINNRSIRIGFHSPFASMIEAILSRGDKRAGELFLEAYKKGARLDSWDDHLNRDLWKNIIENADWNVVEYTCSDHADFTDLYNNIDLMVSEKSLEKENNLSHSSIISEPCDEICPEFCGVCKQDLKVRNSINEIDINPIIKDKREEVYSPYLLGMKKTDTARFIGHLDFSRAVERTLYRCQFPLKMSEGFNPKPKIEFANPLSLGSSSDEEILLIELTKSINEENMINMFNEKSPRGIKLYRLKALNVIEGKKKYTLMKNWGGCDWLISNTHMDLDELFHKINSLIKDKNLIDSFPLVQLDKSHIKIRHIFFQHKVAYNSVNKFLRDNFDSFNHFRIHRLQSWARDLDGNLVTYFDFL